MQMVPEREMGLVCYSQFLSLPLWLSQSRKALGKRPLQIYAKLLTADVMHKPSKTLEVYISVGWIYSFCETTMFQGF